ncbi:hypothetical protein EV356DRAFT_509801 [Viridothelium virens]|uniref:Uncharacterized protein n=1 Tax=Viridothelium virens TaxID=1048519 RepID=A0A6A6HJA4_VIRVR|nr:hypothetical protein EV356DRAFT_509801 [Viridothelium virens]
MMPIARVSRATSFVCQDGNESDYHRYLAVASPWLLHGCFARPRDASLQISQPVTQQGAPRWRAATSCRMHVHFEEGTRTCSRVMEEQLIAGPY